MGIGVLLIHSEIGVTAIKVVVGVSSIDRDFEHAAIPHLQTEETLV